MKRNIILFIFTFFFVFSMAVLVSSSTSECAVKKTKLNVKKLTLVKADNYTLRVYNMKKRQTIKFSSDDSSIVTVTEVSGHSRSTSITAVNVGSTYVRANIYNKKGKLIRSLKTSVKVTPYAISIKFTQRKVKLNVADTMKLSVIIKPVTSQELPLFESSNSDIVSVNSRGIITALSTGEATITATLLSSGQKVRCTVQVLRIPDTEEVQAPRKTPILPLPSR